MEIYADYTYYTGTFGGSSIPEADFTRLSRLASLFLDAVTLNRAASWPDRDLIQTAACALAEQYQAIDEARAAARLAIQSARESGGAEVQSESVEKWSRTWRSGGDSAKQALSAAASEQEALLDVAKLYLGASGILKARGVTCDCYRTR